MMRALDLFCGAGGASMGLHMAGFDVVGIDHRPQPRYPFRFIQADAMRPPLELGGFDLIWASPPCQRFSTMTARHRRRDDHPDLIDATRAMLAASGAWTIIENVPAAPLLAPIVLTGDMFGLNTYRRRHFECSFFVLAAPPQPAFGPKTRPGAVTVAGHSGGGSRRDGWRNGGRAAWQQAMGIDWMTNAEMAQAIPPAYAHFLGTIAAAHLGRRAA